MCRTKSNSNNSSKYTSMVMNLPQTSNFLKYPESDVAIVCPLVNNTSVYYLYFVELLEVFQHSLFSYAI